MIQLKTTRRLILIAVLLQTALLLCVGEVTAAMPDVHPLSVEQAIQEALSNNDDIKITRTAVEKARAAVEKAGALFLPRVSVFSEVLTGDAPSAYLFKTIDQRSLPSSVNFNDPGSFTNVETGIMAGLNLYNGGRDTAMKQMAQADVSESAAKLNQSQNQIVAAVIETYFSILKAQDYVAIADQSVATVKEELRVMTVRYQGGSVLKSDILSLEVRLAEADKTLVQSRNLSHTLQAVFATLLAREPVDDFILEKECDCPVQLPATYEEARDMALKKRSEMAIARQQVEKAKLAADVARAGYHPKVDLNTRYYLDSDDLSYNLSKANYTAALILEWDIFTGHSTRQELTEAAEDLKAAVALTNKTRLSILREVKTAYLNLSDARQRLDVAQRSVAMADESLNLVRKRYQGGSESITRYLETELALNRARINRATAYYDEKIAQSFIARSLGLLSTLWTQENQHP